MHATGRRMVAEARREAIEGVLRTTGSVTIHELEARFGVSPVTARRDLIELERRGSLRRTHGGAVLPATLTSDGSALAGEERSFTRRLDVAPDAKRRLADEAVALLSPHETVFLDASTTSWFVAQRMIESGLPLTVLTNNIPLMHLVLGRAGPQLELLGIGGTLRRIGGSLVGPLAVQTVESHFADRCFVSVKGVTAGGVLTEADPLEAEVKRAMIAQSTRTTVLLERSKLSARGLSEIARVADVSSVVAYGVTAGELEPLQAPGVELKVIGPD